MKGYKGFRVLGFAVFAAFSIFTSTRVIAAFPVPPAAPVKLAWSPSIDTNVTGYAVYYGKAQSGMTNRLDAGPAAQANIANLTANTNYFFYVVAYTASGTESTPSNLIQYTPPVLTPMQLAQSADGSAHIQFRGPANSSCTIQYTESLNPPNWQTLASATAAADGTVTLDDPAAAQSAERFYRASVP